jgi:hypothetical protein
VKLSRFALGSAMALSLVGGSLLAAPVGAQDECGVSIYGGDVMNETVIDIQADAGTAISDASAGSNNAATTNGGGDDVDTASAGNGGVATASANGGAISTGDINSGGNVGNAISVGNTDCGYVAPAGDYAPAEDVVYDVAAEEVVALPATGVGVGEVGGLFALLASAGAAAASLGLRRR